MAKQVLSLVSDRGALNTREYNDSDPASRDAAMDYLVSQRRHWHDNAPHLVDGLVLTIVDSAAPVRTAAPAPDHSVTAEVRAGIKCAAREALEQRSDIFVSSSVLREYRRAVVSCWRALRDGSAVHDPMFARYHHDLAHDRGWTLAALIMARRNRVSFA